MRKFFFNRPIPHGTATGYTYYKCRCSICKSGQRERTIAWRRTKTGKESSNATYKRIKAERLRKREMVDLIKLERGCRACGYNKHPAALHFDHVRGKKRFTISQVFGRVSEILFSELQKCEVLCANCHAEKHWKKPRLAAI